MTLKIALVSESVAPDRGGAETSTAQFIQHLLGHGLKVDLYTRSPVESKGDLTVHRVDPPSLIRALKTVRFSRRVDELLAGRRYDVVHAITPCLRADVYQPRGGTVPETVERNLALCAPGAPRTVKKLANRFNLKQRTMIRLERRLVQRSPAPMVVAISSYVQEQLTRHYRLPEQNIRRIFNGVDFHPPTETQRSQDRQTIRRMYGVADDEVFALMIAHNFKLKGVGQWIRALCILTHADGPRIKTVIIGKADPRPYRALARKLRIEDAVMFAGYTKQVSAFYSAADIFVHPTFYDPCSRVVLEAMLHGVPPVTTQFNGAAEAIDDGVNGRVIDAPDDIEELARAARQAAAAPLRDAVQRMHDELAERLSMERHARQIVELYRHIAAGPAR